MCTNWWEYCRYVNKEIFCGLHSTGIKYELPLSYKGGTNEKKLADPAWPHLPSDLPLGLHALDGFLTDKNEHIPTPP